MRGAAWGATGAGAIEDLGTWTEVDVPATVLSLPSLQDVKHGGDTVRALSLCATAEIGPLMLCAIGTGPASASMWGTGSHGGKWWETPRVV
jgi:hypothetical protein